MKQNPEFENFNRTMDAILNADPKAVKEAMQTEKKANAKVREVKGERKRGRHGPKKGSQDMVRDMDLVRNILLRIEQDPTMDNTDYRSPDFEYFGVEQDRVEELRYDLALLIERGFLNGNAEMVYNMPAITGLTWQGHEFIADITDPDIWQKTKDRLKTVGGAGIAFAWEIAKAELRKKLGLP